MGEQAWVFFFFPAEDGIRDLVRSRGLEDVYKRLREMGGGSRHVASEAMCLAHPPPRRKEYYVCRRCTVLITSTLSVALSVRGYDQTVINILEDIVLE